MAKVELSQEFQTIIDSMPDAEKQKKLISLYIELNSVHDAMRNDCELQAASLEVERLFGPYKLVTKQNKLAAQKARNDNKADKLMEILGEEWSNQDAMSNDVALADAEADLSNLKGPYTDSIKEIKEKINYIVESKFG